jgi:hypothetical protein
MIAPRPRRRVVSSGMWGRSGNAGTGGSLSHARAERQSHSLSIDQVMQGRTFSLAESAGQRFISIYPRSFVPGKRKAGNPSLITKVVTFEGAQRKHLLGGGRRFHQSKPWSDRRCLWLCVFKIVVKAEDEEIC